MLSGVKWGCVVPFIYSLTGVGVDGEVGIEEPDCGIRGLESAERVDTDSWMSLFTV